MLVANELERNITLEDIESQFKLIKEGKTKQHKRRSSDVIFSNKYRISTRNLSAKLKNRKKRTSCKILYNDAVEAMKTVVVKRDKNKVIFNCTKPDNDNKSKKVGFKLPDLIKSKKFQKLKEKLIDTIKPIKRKNTGSVLNTNSEKIYYHKMSLNRKKSIFSSKITHYTKS